MSIDCFFFLYINRPGVQIRFGDTEGLFYFPEVVICVIYLQGVHVQFWCHQEIISCIFQIFFNLCLVDFNDWLSVFSVFICICDLYIFDRIPQILPCHFFVSGIVGGFVHHFHDLGFLFLCKGRIVGNNAFFFYLKRDLFFLTSFRIRFPEFIRKSIHTGF